MIDIYFSFLEFLNNTIPNQSVIQLCKKAHINERKVVYYSDFKKKKKN